VFHLSDVSVVPSQWAEPCARSIIEAMLAGTPVVASRVGGNVELLEGEWATGLFTAKDPDNLARTILARLNWRSDDPSLTDRVQQYAIQRFNLVDKITAIEQIMQQTLQAGELTGQSIGHSVSEV
jgi:glycosyltransferase involved in cell wall biosynthesis